MKLGNLARANLDDKISLNVAIIYQNQLTKESGNKFS